LFGSDGYRFQAGSRLSRPAGCAGKSRPVSFTGTRPRRQAQSGRNMVFVLANVNIFA
jgi:hypothetical protein